MGFASLPDIQPPWHGAPSIVPGANDEMASDRAVVIEQMVDRIQSIGPQSGADVLRELRRAFPDSPLEFRVRALEAAKNLRDMPKAC